MPPSNVAPKTRSSAATANSAAAAAAGRRSRGGGVVAGFSNTILLVSRSLADSTFALSVILIVLLVGYYHLEHAATTTTAASLAMKGGSGMVSSRAGIDTWWEPAPSSSSSSVFSGFTSFFFNSRTSDASLLNPSSGDAQNNNGDDDNAFLFEDVEVLVDHVVDGDTFVGRFAADVMRETEMRAEEAANSWNAAVVMNTNGEGSRGDAQTKNKENDDASNAGAGAAVVTITNAPLHTFKLRRIDAPELQQEGGAEAKRALERLLGVGAPSKLLCKPDGQIRSEKEGAAKMGRDAVKDDAVKNNVLSSAVLVPSALRPEFYLTSDDDAADGTSDGDSVHNAPSEDSANTEMKKAVGSRRVASTSVCDASTDDNGDDFAGDDDDDDGSAFEEAASSCDSFAPKTLIAVIWERQTVLTTDQLRPHHQKRDSTSPRSDALSSAPRIIFHVDLFITFGSPVYSGAKRAAEHNLIFVQEQMVRSGNAMPCPHDIYHYEQQQAAVLGGLGSRIGGGRGRGGGGASSPLSFMARLFGGWGGGQGWGSTMATVNDADGALSSSRSTPSMPYSIHDFILEEEKAREDRIGIWAVLPAEADGSENRKYKTGHGNVYNSRRKNYRYDPIGRMLDGWSPEHGPMPPWVFNRLKRVDKLNLVLSGEYFKREKEAQTHNHQQKNGHPQQRHARRSGNSKRQQKQPRWEESEEEEQGDVDNYINRGGHASSSHDADHDDYADDEGVDTATREHEDDGEAEEVPLNPITKAKLHARRKRLAQQQAHEGSARQKRREGSGAARSGGGLGRLSTKPPRAKSGESAGENPSPSAAAVNMNRRSRRIRSKRRRKMG